MMDDIELHAKSDRELLILAVEKLNTMCHRVNKLDRAVHGNGVPGLKAQVWVLWGIFSVGGGMVVINYIKAHF
jgi:hypothetical protein